MNCDQAREHLLDLMYDELPPGAERDALDAHLSGCPRCRTELDELGITRRFLAAWDDAVPAAPRRPLAPAAAAGRPLLHFPRISWLTAAAALLVIAAGVLVAVTPVQIRYHDNAVEIRLGSTPAAPTAAGSEWLRTVDQMIAESETRQMGRFMDAMQNVHFRLEDERYRDRQAIQQGFDLVKEIYMDQIERNNQLLDLSLQQADYRTRIQPR